MGVDHAPTIHVCHDPERSGGDNAAAAQLLRGSRRGLCRSERGNVYLCSGTTTFPRRSPLSRRRVAGRPTDRAVSLRSRPRPLPRQPASTLSLLHELPPPVASLLI